MMPPENEKWLQKFHTDFEGEQVVVLQNFSCFLRLQLLNGRDITLVFLFENFM